MSEVYAQLWIKIKKTLDMKEKAAFEKWRQLIAGHQKKGIDVNDVTSSFAAHGKIPSDEIWVGLGAGKKTEDPDYDAMYAIFGKFVQYLYQEMLFSGTMEITLERTGDIE